MSFLGGAECSTAGNPLSQFTKHVQDDKSLQRDRLVGRGPGGNMQGMRSTGGVHMSGSQDNVSSATGSRSSVCGERTADMLT
jgi:peroxin-5